VPPFKGIISRDGGEPWGPTGMTSLAWLRIPTELIQIRHLIATQPGVYFEALIRPRTPVGGDEYPHVIFWRDDAYLEDGHTRVIRAALRGESMIEARVLRVDS
jgi:hypothetical protein